MIGLCAYFSGFDTLPLTWYPLARDSSFYLICLGTLLGVSNDRNITWYDALILCLLYALYVLIMYFDPPIRTWCMKNLDNKSKHGRVTPGPIEDGENQVSSSKEAKGGNEVEDKAEPGEEEEEEEPHDGPPEWPDTRRGQLIYIINAPLNWGLYLTIPDCRVERLKKYYMLTFTLAILWIGALSYVMLVMAEDIGITIGETFPASRNS